MSGTLFHGVRQTAKQDAASRRLLKPRPHYRRRERRL